jgi:predicted PurR-regulated permease PerM
MTTTEPLGAGGRIPLDRRLGLAALVNAAALLVHLFVVVLGGLWLVATMNAKVDTLNASLTALKSDVTTALTQLRADLSAATDRLDRRVDSLRDRPVPR